jgi:hypothetical protein
LVIANNILNNNDPKYRTLKSTSKVLSNKVLNVKGGHDYLIAVRLYQPLIPTLSGLRC